MPTAAASARVAALAVVLLAGAAVADDPADAVRRAEESAARAEAAATRTEAAAARVESAMERLGRVMDALEQQMTRTRARPASPSPSTTR